MIQIPVPDVNDSLTEVDLDGVTYFLRLSWNSEAELWALSIENAYNALVVAGIAVVPGSPLLAGYRHLTVPAGELIALAPDRRDAISRGALPSGEVALIYVDAQEVADGQV
ncbi:phage baseplate plug family protein [Achromobacter marplatensis]|uniref:phage baseplate plug family protein n=1 Tax=Achromobacter marplatensis TaxID=470868 RepID=UPI0039F6CC4B